MHVRAHALGHCEAERRRAVRQDHRELFTADPGHRVHRADAVLQRVRHALQHQVAGRVAVAVVDLLEVVDVDHQHQCRLAGAGDAVDLAGECGLELAPVRDAGERVAARELAQRVDHRLHPDHRRDRMPVGQLAPGLRQQLHGRRQPQPGGAFGWSSGFGREVHERDGGKAAGMRSSLSAGSARTVRI